MYLNSKAYFSSPFFGWVRVAIVVFSFLCNVLGINVHVGLFSLLAVGLSLY